MSYEPKNLHDGLRRLQLLVGAVERDLSNYLDDPKDSAAEYLNDPLEAIREAQNTVVWVRTHLKEKS